LRGQEYVEKRSRIPRPSFLLSCLGGVVEQIACFTAELERRIRLC